MYIHYCIFLCLLGKENYDPTLSVDMGDVSSTQPEPDSTSADVPESDNSGQGTSQQQSEEQWPEMVFDP